MKKIISILVLIAMLLPSVLVTAADNGIEHDVVVGSTTITIKGEADDAAGLPITLKVKDGDTLVHVDQMMVDDNGGFVFTFAMLTEEVQYTYTLRHPRLSNPESGTFYIASADSEASVLNAFRGLNVGPDVADRIGVMTTFLTTPLNAQVLNLNLIAFNALVNPSAVSEGMCNAFNQLTTLELISTKFAELVSKQAIAEEELEQQHQVIQNIQAATPGDMLALIETNAELLGVKTEYGFAIIKEAYDDGNVALAESLKTTLQGAVTPQTFNQVFVNFVALIAYEEATWGQFDAIENYYRDELGGVFDEARNILTDLELSSLKSAVQDEPTFADINSIKSFVQTKTTEIVNARPNKKPNTGGNGGGGNNGGGVQIIKGGGTSFAPSNNSTQTTFTDCDHVSWAIESILRLKAKGIVNGKSATTFNPDDKTTREEFLKMLLLACDIKPAAVGTTGFDDVQADNWCAPYVAKAIELGIVSGVSETMFGTGQQITRQDMAVLCYRMLNKLNKKPSTDGANTFADAENIADYAAEAVSAMQGAGIVKGMGDNRFEPLLSATRAETAVIIDRIMNLK